MIKLTESFMLGMNLRLAHMSRIMIFIIPPLLIVTPVLLGLNPVLDMIPLSGYIMLYLKGVIYAVLLFYILRQFFLDDYYSLAFFSPFCYLLISSIMHLPFYWQKWIPVSMSQNKPNTPYLNIHLGFLNQVTLVVNITPLIHSYRWPEVTKGRD